MKKSIARIAKVGLLMAVWLGLSIPAQAQSNGSRKKAEKIMAQANGAFDLGDFRKALSLAEKASHSYLALKQLMSLSPTASSLKNGNKRF